MPFGLYRRIIGGTMGVEVDAVIVMLMAEELIHSHNAQCLYLKACLFLHFAHGSLKRSLFILHLATGQAVETPMYGAVIINTLS